MGAGLLTTGSPPFPRRGGVPHCGPHSLEALAQQHKIPLFVYNGGRIPDRLRTLEEAFAGNPPEVPPTVRAPSAAAPESSGPSPRLLIACSVKANPGLTELIRPSHYGGVHAVSPVRANGQAGAYGFTMASNYNSRPRPAEVLVHGDLVTLERRRESYADLVRGEADV